MMVHRITPILNVSNLEQSFTWFEKLGWRKGWDWGSPPTFGGVRCGHCELFLCLNGQGGRDTGGSRPSYGLGSNQATEQGVWMTVWVDDVDELHERCTAQGIDIACAPMDLPWGVRELHVRHPDGHVLRLSQRIGR